MAYDTLLHDLVMDLRQIAIDHPETLDITQRCIDRVYAIKRTLDHSEPIKNGPKKFRPVVQCGSISMAVGD